jgi:plastocyanin
MTDTTITTSVTRAVGFASVSVFPEAGAPRRTTAAKKSSRYAFSPERIEVRVGERVRLNVVSVDGTHGVFIVTPRT